MKDKFVEMVAHLAKPGVDLMKEWNANKASLVHMLVGMYDELGELVGYTDRENLLEEAGDFIFYLQGAAKDLNIPLDLSNREPLKFEDWNSVETLLTTLKRHLFYNKPLPEVDELQKMFKDSADSIYNFVTSKILYGWESMVTFEEILEANYTKLMLKRYPNGFSNEAANQRLDKQGTPE